MDRLLFCDSSHTSGQQQGTTASSVFICCQQQFRAGFRLSGSHQQEEVIDHCTIETFDTLQTVEEVTTVTHPGHRFLEVGR